MIHTGDQGRLRVAKLRERPAAGACSPCDCGEPIGRMLLTLWLRPLGYSYREGKGGTGSESSHFLCMPRTH